MSNDSQIALSAAESAAASATTAANAADQAVGIVATPNDGTVAALVGDSASDTTAALKAAYAGSVVLTGPGIDSTGATTSTAAVQARINSASALGATVQVPQGAVIALDDTITLPTRTRLTGPGELRWTAGIANKPALLVNGNGCSVEGVRLTNPNSLGAQTGNANYGILVQANDFRAVGNHLERFQYGITVASSGEWANIVIHGNRIKDVLGAGDGPASGSANGEDRGDGITVWGCQASIVGNVVNALAGTDARIGIHVEGLPGQEGTQNPPHPSSMVTIQGNVIYGKFRRGIVTEDVRNVAIAGNSIADATWWGIAAASSGVTSTSLMRNVTISGNAIKWTRLSTDNQGSNYSPIRAPIMVYGGVVGAAVTGNAIEVQSTGAAEAFIVTAGPSSTVYPMGCVIANNVGRVVSGAVVNEGIRLDNYSVRIKVAGNVLAGFSQYGIYGWSAYRCSITGNDLDGIGSGTIKGIVLENDSTTQPVSICDNKISGCPTLGVSRMFAQNTLANDNIIEGATTGFDWYSATNGKAVGNLIIGATTAHANRDATILITD